MFNPPSLIGLQHFFRLTVSILVPHRKGHTSLLYSAISHFGMVSTLARCQNLLAPSRFIIRLFPTRDRVRSFHKLRHFPSFSILGFQLSCSVSMLPNHIPNSFNLWTQFKLYGVSVRLHHAPSHMALVFSTFNLSPVPCSYWLTIWSKYLSEMSSLTKTVVSSAYWFTLKDVPWAPGSRKPLMLILILMLIASISAIIT